MLRIELGPFMPWNRTIAPPAAATAPPNAVYLGSRVGKVAILGSKFVIAAQF